MADLAPYEDPNHPGNRLRPRVRCVGCGELGCVTYWGPWCFTCNVSRMRRITAALEALCTPKETTQVRIRAALGGGFDG